MSKILRIERVFPRPDGIYEEPFLTPDGYKMADPRVGDDRHHAKHAIFVKTLDEVAVQLERGVSLWMKDVSGKLRETLISASGLKAIRS